jgi:hypothetical protein
MAFGAPSGERIFLSAIMPSDGESGGFLPEKGETGQGRNVRVEVPQRNSNIIRIGQSRVKQIRGESPHAIIPSKKC